MRLVEKRYGLDLENLDCIFVVQDGRIIDICENHQEAMNYCWDENNVEGHEIHLVQQGNVQLVKEIEY